MVRHDGKTTRRGRYATRDEALAAARQCLADPSFDPDEHGERELDVENLLASLKRPDAIPSGVKRLAIAMIELARADLRGMAWNTKHAGEMQAARASALAWVRGDIGCGVTSFRGACSVLELEPESLRRWLYAQNRDRNGAKEAEAAADQEGGIEERQVA